MGSGSGKNKRVNISLRKKAASKPGNNGSSQHQVIKASTSIDNEKLIDYLNQLEYSAQASNDKLFDQWGTRYWLPEADFKYLLENNYIESEMVIIGLTHSLYYKLTDKSIDIMRAKKKKS